MAIDISTMPEFRPYTNIQPFTVRDGATYLLQLEAIKDWLRDYVIPSINTETGELAENWKQQTEALIVAFDGAVTTMLETVNTAVEGVEQYKDAAEAAQAAAEAAAALAEQFASNVEEVQDTAITAIFNDAESAFRQAADGAFMVLTDLAPYAKTAEVEAYVQPVADDVTALNSLTGEGRLSEDVMEDTYPVYVEWDGTEYPAKEGFKLFFGPRAPGIGDLEGYWANPALTTLPTVAATVLDESTDLYENVQTITSGNFVNVPLTSLSAQSNPFAVIGSTKLYGFELVKSSNGRLAGTIDVPFGWISARLRVFYIHLTGSGNVRFSRAASSYRNGAAPRDATDISVTAVPSSAGQMSSYFIPGEIDLTQQSQVSVSIARISSSELDTLASSIFIVGARLEKTA